MTQRSVQHRTRLAHLLTIVGCLLILGAFVYSYAQYSSLQDKVEQKTAISDSLDVTAKSLADSIEVVKNGPVAALITPKALSVELEGRKDQNGWQLYNFILWIEVPHVRKKDIEMVKYYFDYPTMLKKERIGTVPGNGFAVNYTGWGCLNTVTLTIVLKNGDNSVIDFQMCDNLVYR